MENETPKRYSRQVRFYTAHTWVAGISLVLLFFSGLYSVPSDRFFAVVKYVVFASAAFFAITTNSVFRIWTFAAIAIFFCPFLPICDFDTSVTDFVHVSTFFFFIATLVFEFKENCAEVD